MSTLSTANIQTKAANTPPVIKDVNGTECGKFARAYVVFVGSTNAILDSFNVSSVTENSTGNYSVNFTTAFPDANYAVTHGGHFNDGNGFYHSYRYPTTTKVDLYFISTANAYREPVHTSCVIHKG